MDTSAPSAASPRAPPPAVAAVPPSTSSSTPSAPVLPPPAARPAATLPKLARLPAGWGARHAFLRPAKRIHDGPDVARFLVSQAYRDIGLFLLQLNHALCPRTTTAPGPGAPLPTVSTTTVFTLQSPRADPPSVRRLQQLLARLAALVDEAPPDPGPRRFGNASFRTWHRLLAERVQRGGLLTEFIPELAAAGGGEEKSRSSRKEEEGEDDGEAAAAAEGSEGEGGGGSGSGGPPTCALDEVEAYFLGSFGSSQRLDYGTGHELSFLAFLGCLWKLGVFADGDPGPDGEAVERSIVLGVIEPYLHVVRKLILTYTLEPAGSHGVWGLDDHSFLPYIFGSAQLTRPIYDGAPAAAAAAANEEATSSGDNNKTAEAGQGPASAVVAAAEPMPQEGSAPRAPKPADILKPATVEVQRERNMYFSAVGFIHDVKKGPFWEHSPILFDVSGIKDGWGKINKGMIKMFNAEVLSKFPVVQHFPFGSLFSWDADPDADVPATTVHMANQPVAAAATAAALKGATAAAVSPSPAGAASSSQAPVQPTAAPWAQATRMPGAGPTGLPGPGIPYSRVPASVASAPAVSRGVHTTRPGGPAVASSAATRAPPAPSGQGPPPSGGSGTTAAQSSLTRAPWAK